MKPRTVYRLLLWLYPPAFRARYGRLMEEALAADLAARRRSAPRVVAHAFLDTLTTAGAEWASVVRPLLLPTAPRRAPARSIRSSSRSSLAPFRSSPSRSHAPMEAHDMLHDFLQDVRYGARALLKTPGFVALALIILALGIGANTTIFTLTNQLFFIDPPAVADPDRLVRVEMFRTESGHSNWWSYPNYAFYAEHQQSLSGIAAYDPGGMVVSMRFGGEPRSGRLWPVSGNYFEVLGVRPSSGRLLQPEDDVLPQGRRVVVLGNTLWQRAFGGDPAAVGRTLEINGHAFEIVGVAPAGFRGIGPSEIPPDVWVPVSVQPLLAPGTEWLERIPDGWVSWLQAFGRLSPGMSREAAESELRTVNAALAGAFPQVEERGVDVRLLDSASYSSRQRERLSEFMRLLTAVVAAVLLIAGVNLALLLLARGSARGRELAVRLAVGARRGRLVRQLLTETLLLALAGGLLGYALAFAAADLASSVLPLQSAVEFSPDLRVLGFTLGIAVLATLLFGMVPALVVVRPEVVPLLKGGRLSAGRSWLRGTLVVAQVALSLLLVTAAALLVRSLRSAEAVELGFETQNRLIVSMSLNHHGYEEEEIPQFVTRARERLAALPGVTGVSASLLFPFRGQWNSNVARMDQEISEEDPGPLVNMNGIAADYFEVLGIPLLAGRGITDADGLEAPRVAVLNETAARLFFPGENAVGRQLRDGDEEEEAITVVGVVADSRFHQIGDAQEPYAFRSMAQHPWGRVSMIVATAAAPEPFLKPVQDALHELDPGLAFSHALTLDDAVERVLGPYRMGARVVTLFGLLALLLAAVGLYGVLSYRVVRERRTIGVRMALGADGARVAGSVVRGGLALVLVGIALGWGAALLTVHSLESFLFGVEARDPWSFTLVPLVLLAVAVVASLVPARRAAGVDPMEALREE